MTKPIKPSEIVEAKIKTFPAKVVQTWNNLITDHWNGHVSRITQNEAVAALMGSTGLSRSGVFDSGYLDIEDMYRKEGWKVYYDKPGYCETYEAYYEFTKGKGK